MTTVTPPPDVDAARTSPTWPRPLPNRPPDRSTAAIWLVTRAAMVAVTIAAARLLPGGDPHQSFVDRWTQWDVDLLIEIARYGYAGDPVEPHDQGLPAFFPGFPLLLRAVHAVVPDWGLAALLIVLVAGGVSTVALARLGEREGPAGSGRLAALALLLSPAAVFLFAGYTESLFLAFALPAWLLARQGRWGPAVLCAAAAGTVRVTALFLAVALIVEFVTRARTAGRWREAPWLVVPFVPMAGYVVYQWSRTGDWGAWLHAQERGWGRSLVPPWEALQTTVNEAFYVQGPFTGAFRAELVAAAVGVAVTAWLLARRRWAESAYVGLQMAALLSSAFYLSIGRATLLWWPLWLAVGALGVRRRGWYVAILILMAPIMTWYVVRFTSGGWAG